MPSQLARLLETVHIMVFLPLKFKGAHQSRAIFKFVLGSGAVRATARHGIGGLKIERYSVMNNRAQSTKNCNRDQGNPDVD